MQYKKLQGGHIRKKQYH